MYIRQLPVNMGDHGVMVGVGMGAAQQTTGDIYYQMNKTYIIYTLVCIF